MRKILIISLLFTSCMSAPANNNIVKKDSTKSIIESDKQFVYINNNQKKIDSLVSDANAYAPKNGNNTMQSEDEKSRLLIELKNRLENEYVDKILKNVIVNIIDIHHEVTLDGLTHLVFLAESKKQDKCVFEMDYPFADEEDMYKSGYYKLLAPKTNKGTDTIDFYIANVDVSTKNHSWYNMKLYDMDPAPPGIVKFTIYPK